MTITSTDTKSNKINSAKESRVVSTRNSLRISPIDNWSEDWDQVSVHVCKTGKAKNLRVDADGWLSARQLIVAAFVGETAAAHVCFTVSPTGNGQIEAKLDSYGIDPKFAGRGIESQLHQAAVERAKTLRCEKLKNFRFNSNWC